MHCRLGAGYNAGWGLDTLQVGRLDVSQVGELDASQVEGLDASHNDNVF